MGLSDSPARGPASHWVARGTSRSVIVAHFRVLARLACESNEIEATGPDHRLRKLTS
jgi:hypothetical protein